MLPCSLGVIMNEVPLVVGSELAFEISLLFKASQKETLLLVLTKNGPLETIQ